MKRNYITDYEYQKIEHEIYNDLPLSMDKIIPGSHKTLDKKFVEKVILPKEEWIVLDDGYRVLTSYGRMLNTYTKKIIKPSVTGTTVAFLYSVTSLRCSREFKKIGWEYNHKEIVRRYMDNKWEYSWNGSSLKQSIESYLFGE